MRGVNYTDCGAIKDLGRTVNYNGTVVGGLGVLSSTQSLGGTSGGPYYKLGRGYGVHSGSDDSAGEQYYQGLIEALNAYSLRLVQHGTS